MAAPVCQPILDMVLLSVVVIFLVIHLCASQRQVVDIGPRNITRTEGETNVYIPCPFAGASNPLWIINGVNYEAFHLPDNMLSVSYGLLITHVDQFMDGNSLQCTILRDGNLLKSTVGILSVEKDLTSRDGGLIGTTRTSTFSMDHQSMIFGKDFKTLRWTQAMGCNGYKMTTSFCNNTLIPQKEWDPDDLQDRIVSIPTSFLTESDDNSNLVYFNLVPVDRTTTTVCPNSGHIPEIAIQPKDITDNKMVSFDGFCFRIESIVLIYVILPSKSGGIDCPCAIHLRQDNTYTLSDCSCGDDTIFQDSFLVVRWSKESQPFYYMCLLNLTVDMNSTVLHFYELYRSCVDDYGNFFNKPYREYIESFMLLIVLPDPPDVEVVIDVASGNLTVNFSSKHREGILLDYYQIILTDVTNLTVFNIITTSNSVTYISEFNRTKCTPYQARAQAHNEYGYSENNVTGIVTQDNSDQNGDPCTCISQTVDADIDFLGNLGLTEDVSSVQVNCSHNYNQTTSIFLYITVQESGTSITSDTTILLCEDQVIVQLDYLTCDTSYDLELSWIPDTESNLNVSCCPLIKLKDKTFPCSDNNLGIKLPLAYIILIAVVALLVVIVLLMLITIISLCVHMQKKKHSNYSIQSYYTDNSDYHRAEDT